MRRSDLRFLSVYNVTVSVALKTEHEWQLNEITERFEGIKHSLSVSAEEFLVSLQC